MSPLTDAARAAEIVEKIRCTPGSVDRSIREEMWAGLIAKALDAARADGFASAGLADAVETAHRLEREACHAAVGRVLMEACPCYDGCEKCVILIAALDAIRERGNR